MGAAQRLFLRLKQAQNDGVWSARPHYVLAPRSSKACTSFKGITDATMGHGEGWQYLQVGRFSSAPAPRRRCSISTSATDRCRPTNRSVRRTIGEWVGLLRSCSALEAYCRYYTADLRPRAHRRVPAAQPRVPALGPVRRRARRGSRSATIAQVTTERRRRPRRAAGRPAARLARLRPGRRDPERRSARTTSKASAASARRSMRRSIRATWPTRSKWRWPSSGP